MQATSTAQRIQLSEFLKSCRARLQPTAVGLPQASRRRTPGLRREDVAALAGLSATWYTWLEQGRDVRASDRVLESLSRTLRMSPEERDYLFLLAQNRTPPLSRQAAEDVSPAVQRTLDALSVPALVITLRWDIVYWNRMYAAVIRNYDSTPAADRNLVKLLMVHPEYQTDQVQYEAMAARIVAKLKMDYSQAGGESEFEGLIQELRELSPLFMRLWDRPEITARSEGVHLVRHPRLGDIALEHTSYQVEGAHTLRALIYAPENAASAHKIAAIAQQVHGFEMPERLAS
jgi:transcriptional regulator with XRE-family HTH domain